METVALSGQNNVQEDVISRKSLWKKTKAFFQISPKTAWSLILAMAMVLFIVINAIRYTYKKGFVINEIKLSKTLMDEGMSNESVRTMLKQYIETYITNLSLLQGDHFEVGEEMFSSADIQASLTFNTALGSINYSKPVELVGEWFGGNDQDIINISITDDDLSYECYLRIKNGMVWSCKTLKADFLNKQYAFKNILLKLSKRILELSHPFVMAEYYCNTDQIDEGLRLANDLMNDDSYKIRKRDSSVIFAFYQRLGYFQSVKSAAESWAINNPKEVSIRRILLIDAIWNDSPLHVIRSGIFSLHNIDKDDPYLVTHKGTFYLKRKMYDSAFAFFSNAARLENKEKYTPEHYCAIQKFCAFTAYLSSRTILADSFFNVYRKSSWAYERLLFFDDSTLVREFKETNIGESTVFGNFILGVKRHKNHPKDAIRYFNLADSVAKNNWLVKIFLADCYRAINNYGHSDSLIKNVLAMSPHNYFALAELANLCLNKKDYLNAYLNAKESLENGFLNFSAFNSMIYSCMMLENYDQAADYCYEMLNYFPHNGLANEIIGDLFIQKNMDYKAIYHYKIAQEDYREYDSKANLNVSWKISNFYSNRKRHNWDHYAQDRMLSTLGNLLEKVSQAGVKAIDKELRALDGTNEEVEKYVRLSIESYNRGDTLASLGYSKDALKLDSLSAMANFLQGASRMRLGQFGLAESYMNRGVRLIKQMPDINYTISTLENMLAIANGIPRNREKENEKMDKIVSLLESAVNEQRNKRLQD